MDKLRKSRRPYRASITKLVNEIDQDLAQKVPDRNALVVKIDALDDVCSRMDTLDDKILDQLVEDNCTDEEQDAEWTSIQEYKAKWRLAKSKVDTFLKQRSQSPSVSEYNSIVSDADKKRSYKLPKVEIRKFNGELNEWLGFWSQFEKIHDDEKLHNSDKFQYLVQSMVEGTRAKKLVESYPQSADNYIKVVDALKDRYGDKVLLTEVYVRQLLKLVISNAGKSKDNASLSSMYDELESNLRALESLGITAEQSAAFLYPLVESSLPEEVIKVWQRTPLSGYDEDKDKSVDDRLNGLMKFLRKEVKGAERLAYVKAGIGDASKQKIRSSQGQNTKGRVLEEIPTAAGLYVGERLKCIFCDKSHESRECVKANGMTLEEKNKVVQGKNCCFVCLRTGHRSKACKSFIKCPVCGKRHPSLMCPNLPSHKKSAEGRKALENPVPTVSNNLSCSTKVYLKTIMVTIVGENRKKKVRALLDDGSQRSYVLKGLAEELGLSVVGEEELTHSLFSGVQMKAQKHKRYLVRLQNNKQEVSLITALDQQQICGEIPRLPQGPWMKELKQKRIWISDIGEDIPEIGLLLGADVIGSLLTAQVVHLQNGLTAINTVLGWTLMGRLATSNNLANESVAMTVTSLSVIDSSIQQLWNLELMGIRDPVESQSKEEKEEIARKHFQETVTRSENGRYNVSLPWINGKQSIPSNKTIAEKRLEALTKKLTSEGKYLEYEAIFKDWLQEGIIEEVNPNGCERDRDSHYLPHRAVFKPGSLTTPVRPVFDASCKAQRTPSLNDCLEKGPNLLELIPSILLRFREKKIGIISDIRKAFQMIEIKEEDRDYMRFLWWEAPSSKKHRILRHKRVVFGVNCSPFLLAAVIEFHLKNVKEMDKPVAEKLLKSLYVDNCVSSEDTIEACHIFKEQSVRIMAEAKMELRQWEFGSYEVSGVGQLTSSRCGLDTDQTVPSGINALTTVLGLKWNKETDMLYCDVGTIDDLKGQISKRSILAKHIAMNIYINELLSGLGYFLISK